MGIFIQGAESGKSSHYRGAFFTASRHQGLYYAKQSCCERLFETMQGSEFILISDQAPIYTAMKSYFDEKNLAHIEHKPVKGIFDEPDEENSEWRPQKQTIERSFESLKSTTKRRRGFSSFKGAQIFCYLHKIYYNHLRPHSDLKICRQCLCL